MNISWTFWLKLLIIGKVCNDISNTDKWASEKANKAKDKEGQVGANAFPEKVCYDVDTFNKGFVSYFNVGLYGEAQVFV